MKLSIIIPARNEEKCIEQTVSAIVQEMSLAGIDFEVLIVNDGSQDRTEETLKGLADRYVEVRYINNVQPHGFGLAIRKGLDDYQGDAVAIVMADGSDSPKDIVQYYRKLEEGYECVFGSRFIKGSSVVDYPIHKFVLNRLANHFIRILFGLRHNDITNAFKCYRRPVIDGLRPLLANHFNLTVELPLKAIIRGYSYATVPIAWTNRVEGISKLKIKEMGSRYLFIVLYLFLEKNLSQGDYRRVDNNVIASLPAGRQAPRH